MESNNTVRKPRQTRSIQTKEKILDAAYRLFCEKGYFKTTTNEIARVAGVSIGSLYSYFKDKDTILLEILDRYNASFSKVHETISKDMEQYLKNPREWFRCFIQSMIEVHKLSKELNRELQIIRYSMPAVAAVLNKQNEKISGMTLEYLTTYRSLLTVQDIEAAAVVVNNLISSTVDQIVFRENVIDNKRIIDAGVEAAYKYLMT